MALWGSDLHKLMTELVKGRGGLYLNGSQKLHIPFLDQLDNDLFHTILSVQDMSYNLRPSQALIFLYGPLFNLQLRAWAKQVG